MSEVISTEQRIESYLVETIDKYPVGADNYYARIALELALKARREGDYGIGAVGIIVDDTKVREFPEKNAMFTGLGVDDHAEMRALIAMKSGIKPAKIYPRDKNEHTSQLPKGISVYGSLEPCWMCSGALTNVGAKRSISTVLDGELIKDGDYYVSDGGAMAIGEKRLLTPKVWQNIQAAIGIEFKLLISDDDELKELSSKIFYDDREEVDIRMAERGINA